MTAIKPFTWNTMAIAAQYGRTDHQTLWKGEAFAPERYEAITYHSIGNHCNELRGSDVKFPQGVTITSSVFNLSERPEFLIAPDEFIPPNFFCRFLCSSVSDREWYLTAIQDPPAQVIDFCSPKKPFTVVNRERNSLDGKSIGPFTSVQAIEDWVDVD